MKKSKGFAFKTLSADMALAAAAPVVLVAMVYLLPPPAPPGAGAYVTAPVVRGDLSVRVQATGTIEPTRLVEVSTELTGTIERVLVKPNDIVRAGQVLAELDPATPRAQLARAKAMVGAAEARLDEARAAVRHASAELERKRHLRKRRHASARDIDAAEYAAARAAAIVAAVKAEIDAARADARVAEATLAKTRIVSPIDAVVLHRAAEPGQTIIASMQPPALFKLAENLDNMQLRVDVDEADAIYVVPGQRATFTVQAFPDRTFDARVERIHVGPEIVQGVVTYKAILGFDNRRLRLKPGMTATADITVEQVRDRLLVPNAALRFAPAAFGGETAKPAPGLISQLFATTHAQSATIVTVPTPPPPAAQPLEVPGIERLVHVLKDGELHRTTIMTTFSDGAFTVLKEGYLDEGHRVVVDYSDQPE